MAPTWAVPGLLLFKRNVQNRTGLKGIFSIFFANFYLFLNGPPFSFIEVPSRNIRSKALYQKF